MITLDSLRSSRPDKTLIEVLYPRLMWRSSEARLGIELRRKLRVGRLHAKLPVLARDAVRTELTALIAQALSTHLSDVAISGWRRSTRVQDAAARTRSRSGGTEIVVLGEHTITFTDLPCIEIRVDSAAPARVEVALVVELHVRGVAATIREGRLVELRAEASDVTVALGIGGDRIARRFVTVDLAAVVRSAADGVGLHLGSQPLPSATAAALAPAPAFAPASASASAPGPAEPVADDSHEPLLAIASESVELDVR